MGVRVLGEVVGKGEVVPGARSMWRGYRREMSAWGRLAFMCLLVLAFIGGGLWLYDYCATWFWDSSAEVDIYFVITDAATGQPIPGAILELVVVDNFDPKKVEKLVIPADRAGVAAKEKVRCFAWGTRSGLRITDTHCVGLPSDWTCTAHAPGYASKALWPLCNLEEQGVLQSRPGSPATLTLPIALQKLKP